jgi:hypothetical protein
MTDPLQPAPAPGVRAMSDPLSVAYEDGFVDGVAHAVASERRYGLAGLLLAALSGAIVAMLLTLAVVHAGGWA